MAHIQPTTQLAFWVIPSIGMDGQTPLGNATGISNALSVISGEGEAAFLAAAQGNAAVSTYKPLPAAGTWLEAGQIYGYNAGLVIVRQSHTRTAHKPEDVPALFSVYRAAGGVLDWIANEPVSVGTHRIYGGVEYVCVQSHVTQSDWTPDRTPALWQVYVPPPPQDAPWEIGVAYKVGDIVTYNGSTYRCIQAHTSQAGWTPSAVPALWSKV